MSNEDIQGNMVRVLRDAAPYLLAHRDRKVVVCLAGELVDDPRVDSWLGDLALLQELARMRFAIAFDPGLKDDAKLGAIDEQALASVQQQASNVQAELESKLIAATPSGIRGLSSIASSPFAARSVGVIDGTDLGLRGMPTKIAKDDASSLLDAGKVVLLPPVGIDHEGVRLHLDADEVALAFAKAAGASKLVFILPSDLRSELDFGELTLAQARDELGKGSFAELVARLIEIGCKALEAGIERIHYLDLAQPGSMLLEFLLPDGIAAMLSKDPFDAVRRAQVSDAASIAELIAPSVASGALRPRSIEEIKESIDEFVVVARDQALIACASLAVSGKIAEFGCLAVRTEYSSQAYGQLLLDYCTKQALEQGSETMVAITTQAIDWFSSRGFSEAQASLLDEKRQAQVAARGSKILARPL